MQEQVKKPVLDIIKKGGSIYYTPGTGCFLLIKEGGDKSKVQPTKEEFEYLKRNGVIKRSGVMNLDLHPSHRCEIYEVP